MWANSYMNKIFILHKAWFVYLFCFLQLENVTENYYLEQLKLPESQFIVKKVATEFIFIITTRIYVLL